MIDILSSSIIDTIIQVTTSGFARRFSKNEVVNRLLQKFRITNPDPDDFDALYIYSLVIFGTFKPLPVLNFFRNEHIREAFRENHVNFEDKGRILAKEIESYRHNLQESGEMDSLDYDPTNDLIVFQEVFISVVRKFRPFSHSLIVNDTLNEVRKALDASHFATKNDIDKVIQEITTILKWIDKWQPISDKMPTKVSDLDDLLRQYCEDMLDLHYKSDRPMEDIPIRGKKDVARYFTLDGIYIHLELSITSSPEYYDIESSSVEFDQPYPKSHRRSSLNAAFLRANDDSSSLKFIMQQNDRLIIVGDPGSGKTTLMKWLIAGLLSKELDNTNITSFPDFDSLPAGDMIPVLISCKRLSSDESQWNFNQFVNIGTENFRLASEYKHLLHSLADEGRLLLIFDGLDEAPNGKFIQLAEYIQEIAKSRKELSIIITSRGQGYADAIETIRTSFSTANVQVLDSSDMHDFAERWCRKTFSTDIELKIQKFRELIDQVPHLAQKPLTLSALAIFFYNEPEALRPNLGKIYEAYMTVLFTWNRKLMERFIPWEEAQPQLCQLAYKMIDEDLRQITREEFYALLKTLREKDPLSIICERKPHQFVSLLEKGSALIKEVSTQDVNSLDKATYEFQDEKLKEYFAGLAIYDAHYPNSHQTGDFKTHFLSLAQQIVSQRSEGDILGDEDAAITDPKWLQSLVFYMGIGNQRDIRAVLFAIMNLDYAEFPVLPRGRAILLANFLKDSNADSATAHIVFKYVIQQLNQRDLSTKNKLQRTALIAAIQLLQESSWWLDFRLSFLEYIIDDSLTQERREFLSNVYMLSSYKKYSGSKIDLTNNRQSERILAYFVPILDMSISGEARRNIGNNYVELIAAPFWDDKSWQEWMLSLRERLFSISAVDVTQAALLILDEIYTKRVGYDPELEKDLINAIGRVPKADFSIFWALSHLYSSYIELNYKDWSVSSLLYKLLSRMLVEPSADPLSVRFAFRILPYIYKSEFQSSWSIIAGKAFLHHNPTNFWINSSLTANEMRIVLLRILDDANIPEIEKAVAVQYLGFLDDSITRTELTRRLGIDNEEIRKNANFALSATGDENTSASALERVGLSNNHVQMRDWNLTDKFLLDKILICIFLSGRTQNNKLAYAYIALHLDDFVKMMINFQSDKSVNSADYNSTVLEFNTKRPTKKIKKYMRDRFGFSYSNIVIQRERVQSESQDMNVIMRRSERIANSSNYGYDDSQKDFLLVNIDFMRIGSGYIRKTLHYDICVEIFKRYAEMINIEMFPSSDKIETEDMEIED